MSTHAAAARRDAERYRVDREAEVDALSDETGALGGPPRAAGHMESRSTWVEHIIDQAVRRGDFDDLPLAGKPIPGLGDPDWWLKGLVRREGMTGEGLLPEGLLLRAEDERLDARLEALRHEAQVRAVLTEFNRRVVEARRQLAGGPPVVTPLRDVDAEVTAWRDRRATTSRSLAQVPSQRPGWLARLLGR